MKRNHEFHLSDEELGCLAQFASADQLIATLVTHPEKSPGKRTTIRLSRREAEQLRDFLTTQLASVGFDENYSPNERGRMLENLIDRFFLP
jgi:hypothetical protein